MLYENERSARCAIQSMCILKLQTYDGFCHIMTLYCRNRTH